MQLTKRLQYQYDTAFDTTNSVLIRLHIVDVYYDTTLIKFTNDDPVMLEEAVSEWIHGMCLINCRNQMTLRKLEEFQDWLTNLHMDI
jgi:hypothetical protein